MFSLKHLDNFVFHYQQEEIKKQRSHKAADSKEAGSSMLQTQPGIGFNGHYSFGQMSSFLQLVALFFSRLASHLQQLH